MDKHGKGGCHTGSRLMMATTSSKWSHAEAREMLEDLRVDANDAWATVITAKWGETPSQDAIITFYRRAALTSSGTPILACNGETGTRVNCWFAYQLETLQGNEGTSPPPPPEQYTDADKLWDRTAKPRNLEAEWDDWRFQTYIARVEGFFTPVHPLGSGELGAPPIRVIVCTVWEPDRLLSPAGLDLWQIPRDRTPMYEDHPVPLDHFRIKKLISFHAPVEERAAKELGLTQGTRTFTGCVDKKE